ncbi:acyltransferase [Granulicella sp. WH15]|uniref:acyltransferase family protein n=1 Tax=Granulicella sp. WH15 TaxID=2602070 RepID=UPI0013A5B8F6|nr:acyltransferase [Granulicella sp. WH15]
MSLSSSRPLTTRFVDTWASVHFDLLRGVAALLVLIEHLRNLYFIDFPDVTVYRRWMFLPYALSGAGHPAVILFFVLSGYFIGGTVLRAMERSQWSWKDYLLKRFVRLWIVLIPALLLCLAWDTLGMHLGHAPLLYAGQDHNHMIGHVAEALAPHVFFSNLFFLQGILTTMYGTDGALWSLAYEFWYYLLFPLALVTVWPRTVLWRRLLCGVLLVAVAWLVREPILFSFPIWLAGVALFKVDGPSLSPVNGRRIRIIATLVYFPIFFLLGHYPANHLVDDYLLTIATLLYLWLLKSDKDRYSPGAWGVRGSREMARFSFTLYASHTPFLVLLASLVIGDTRWHPSGLTFFYGAILMIVVLLYAYLLALMTEFRTDAVRMRLERWLGMRVVAPALPSNPLADAPPGGGSNQA